MSYLGVDELQKSADICSPLSLLLPGRVRSGRADSVVFSQSLTRVFCFTSSLIWCQIAASALARRRLCRPPRPRLLQRNNGGKKSTLGLLLYSLWRHSSRCPRGRWEMKCSQWLLCFLLDIEQPLKIRLQHSTHSSVTGDHLYVHSVFFHKIKRQMGEVNYLMLMRWERWASNKSIYFYASSTVEGKKTLFFSTCGSGAPIQCI